ncbi:hypothetical protein Slala05_27210 [Streptomyces lavendulae subsp. lavendulae]|nr:hypothetical protein Slala05_27210 [Streptomyces lavendulae subsp. lavendulae]
MEPSKADCDTRSDRVVVICSLLRECTGTATYALVCVIGGNGPEGGGGRCGRKGLPLSLIVIRRGTDRYISGSSG